LSYQVIARKWRPQSFDEVSGQPHVTTALRNAIRSGRIPHAILLTGPRGVGKTTLARLIARCLNCEKGPTDEPCGTCTTCGEITDGRSIDVQEIDAASRTGVDDIREVIESIRYAAAPGKYRIYIIDEVHMLSTSAFNALLKTLEEPPPHSLFIFATTNPEKIPFTVLSRCQRHDLRRIALVNVTERLSEICAAEAIEISAAALNSIAREGDGSMRDAQTLLDQIVSYSADTAEGDTKITDETVAEILDLVDRRVVRGIIEACIRSDAKSALEFVVQATSGGSEARRVADALLELIRNLTVLSIAPEGQALFDGPDEERAELIELAGKTEPARLRRMFRALVRDIEDLSWAPQPSAVLEMAIIRLATLPSGDDVSQLLSRLDRLERRLAADSTAPSGGGGSTSGGTRAAPRDPGEARTSKAAQAPSTAPTNPTKSSSSFRSDSRPDSDTDTDGNGNGNGNGKVEAKADTPANGFDAASGSSGPATPTLGGGAPAQVLFDRFRAKALEMDRAKFASLDRAQLIGIQGSTIALGVTGRFHADRLRTRLDDLEALACQIFDSPTRISVEIIEANSGREPNRDSREQSRRCRQQALNSEPVNLALEVLEAEIVEIRPLGENL